LTEEKEATNARNKLNRLENSLTIKEEEYEKISNYRK
jgi:hypothetical protein